MFAADTITVGVLFVFVLGAHVDRAVDTEGTTTA